MDKRGMSPQNLATEMGRISFLRSPSRQTIHYFLSCTGKSTETTICGLKKWAAMSSSGQLRQLHGSENDGCGRRSSRQSKRAPLATVNRRRKRTPARQLELVVGENSALCSAPAAKAQVTKNPANVTPRAAAATNTATNAASSFITPKKGRRQPVSRKASPQQDVATKMIRKANVLAMFKRQKIKSKLKGWTVCDSSTTIIYSWQDSCFKKMESALQAFVSWSESCGHRDSEFIPYGHCFYDLQLTLRTPRIFARHYLEQGRFKHTLGGGQCAKSYILLQQWHQDYCEHHFQHQRSQNGCNSEPNGLEARVNAARSRGNSQNMGMTKKGNTGRAFKPESAPPLKRARVSQTPFVAEIADEAARLR